jgi:hypothetical protein
MRRKTLIRKNDLSIEISDVTHVLSFGTNNQAQVFGESGELLEIYNLLLLLLVDVLLIKRVLLYYIYLLSRFILQMVLLSNLLSGYSSF